MYLERAGDLTLLLGAEEHGRAPVRCFNLQDGALFVEAVPATDISRRITALQYELVPRQVPGGHMYPHLNSGPGKEAPAASVSSYLWCLTTGSKPVCVVSHPGVVYFHLHRFSPTFRVFDF